MNDSTLKILSATLAADTTLTAYQRGKILAVAKTGEAEPVQIPTGHAPRIYSREEAAKLLGGKTTRFIDQLCRRGLLKKFIPSGNRRSIGVTANSLNNFLGTNA